MDYIQCSNLNETRARVSKKSLDHRLFQKNTHARESEHYLKGHTLSRRIALHVVAHTVEPDTTGGTEGGARGSIVVGMASARAVVVNLTISRTSNCVGTVIHTTRKKVRVSNNQLIKTSLRRNNSHDKPAYPGLQAQYPSLVHDPLLLQLSAGVQYRAQLTEYQLG